MVDRQVKAVLSVQMQGYVDGIGKATKATRELGTESEKLAQTKQSFDLLGRASLAAGGLVAAGLGVAIAKFAEFDEAMSYVQAATGETAEAMASLRQAALDAGASTVYSATEAANAIEELAKAGVSTGDILSGGLTGALDLAAAGGLGVADAAGIAATALKTFNLEGSDMSHVADLLAAGAGKAMGDVTDLSGALNQSAMVANATGLSIEETTATLAAFASQGLLGSDAGTSFKSMLQRLTPQSNEAKNKMKELGIAAYDANGQFIGMEKFAGNLQTALADLTPEQRNSAMATIFGSDAVRAANVLYTEGEEGIRDWITAVDDQGFASEQAAMRLDNLKGDWEALTGAMDTAMISMGEAADGPLRGLVQGLTGLVDKFNEMPAGAQQAVFWVGAVGAAGAIALGSYLLLVPKMAEFKLALDVLGPSAARASRAVGMLTRFGLVGAAAAGAVIGVDALSNELSKNLLPSATDVDNKMRSAKSGVELFGAALYKEGITNTKEAGSLLGNLGKQLDSVADSDFWNPSKISGTANSVAVEIAEIVKADPAKAAAQFRTLANDADLTDRQMRTLIQTVPELKDALIEQATAAGLGSDAQTLLEVALGESAAAAEDQKSSLEELQGVATDTTESVDELADSIRNFGSAQFDTEQASIKFHDSFQNLKEILDEGAGSLDVTTEAGRNTLSAMLDVAQSTNDYAGAVAAMGGGTEEIQGILEAGRQKIIDTRIALGDSEEAARQYADQLVATPETIATQVQLNGIEAAQQALQRFKDTFNAIPNYKGVSVDTIVGNPSLGYVPGRASGGAITGPGTGTSDTAGLFRLSTGEHVLTAADVAAMGGQHAVYGFRESLHGGGSSSAPSGADAAVLRRVEGLLSNLERNGIRAFMDTRQAVGALNNYAR